jgi:hypothetical protein
MLDATPVKLLGVNSPGPKSGADSARDQTGETEHGVIKLVSLARLSLIQAIWVSAACVAVALVMVGSKTGKEGAKLEVGWWEHYQSGLSLPNQTKLPNFDQLIP